MIVLRDQNSELSDGLQFGHYIIVSREAGEGNPIAVKRPLQQKPWRSRRVQRNKPADIAPSLLTIWDLPMLNQWWESKLDASDREVSLKRRVAVRDDGSVFPPDYQAAAIRAGAQTTSDPVAIAAFNKLLNDLTRGMKAPSANGKHHKPTES